MILEWWGIRLLYLGYILKPKFGIIKGIFVHVK